MNNTFFDYPTRQMRKSEMVKIGVPESLLEEPQGATKYSCSKRMEWGGNRLV